MSARRVVVLAVMAIVCLGTSALAQDEELPLSNWSAPPYWTPAVQPRTEGGPDRAMVAHAQRMLAQAEALPSSPLPFIVIAPCRIVDTREAISDGFHQPNFIDDESRTFPFPSSSDCTGLPATAGASSLNVQFRPLTQLAFLTAYPTGTTMPLVSTLTAGPAAWVQNAAIVPAGTGGAIDVYCQYAGRVVIDINGYYAPQSVVTSLNTLSGDVSLVEGSNVTIVPFGNTLLIAATGGPGGDLPAGVLNQTLFSNGSTWNPSSALTNDGTNVGVSGRLQLPATTATSGQITMDGVPFLHGHLGTNTFLGGDAGNFTMGGSGADGRYNTGIGRWAMRANISGSYNTATGVSTLTLNTYGDSNTATGAYSLDANTSGSGNTGTGTNSLSANTMGNFNTGTGSSSLSHNTIGFYNTADGDGALQNNTTASYNTAVGSGALGDQSYDNGGPMWGSYNTAVGYHALNANEPISTSTGVRNTAVGYYSLRDNSTGFHNTGLGSSSLLGNTTGSFNVASGYQSLNLNTTGDHNTALGANAGFYLTTGDYNVDIANGGVADEARTIRIGDSNQTRTFVAGISGVAIGATAIPVLVDVNGQLGTEVSSIRFKQDVASMGEASSGLMELRPVTFRYKAYPDGPLQYGLIAEEVENVMPDLVVRDATGQVETVAYHELPAMLLNELQKQQAKIAAQQVVIEVLTSRLAALEQRLPRTP